MADVTIYCPACNRKLRVPEDQLGQVVQCPLCQGVFVTPLRNPVPATAVTEPVTLAAADDASPRPAPELRAPAEGTPAEATATGETAEASPFSAVHRVLLMPGTLLLVTGVLTIINALAFLNNLRSQKPEQLLRESQKNVPDWMQPMMAQPPSPEVFYVGMLLITVAVLFMSVGTVFGAIHMLRMQRYWLAITGSVLACINPGMGCCLISIPIGAWALVVLSLPQVRSAFSAMSEAEASGPEEPGTEE